MSIASVSIVIIFAVDHIAFFLEIVLASLFNPVS